MFSHDEEEVSDLFQETLINMWKGIDGFREESKISTWIYRVALKIEAETDEKGLYRSKSQRFDTISQKKK